MKVERELGGFQVLRCFSILDCDIASTFAKIDRVELLQRAFPKSSFHINELGIRRAYA